MANTINTATEDHGKNLVSWDFKEFPSYQRTRRWYLGITITGIVLLILAVLERNPLFAVIIVLGWALIFFRPQQQPRNIATRVTEDGVEVGRDFFPYDEINKFWIIYKPPLVKMLYINFKSSLRPLLGIPLEDTDPVKLRNNLRRFLEEDLEKKEEPASDAFGRLLKI